MKIMKEKKALFGLLKTTHSDLQQSLWCSVFLNFQVRKLTCRVSNIPCIQMLICILGQNRMLFRWCIFNNQLSRRIEAKESKGKPTLQAS